MRRDLSKNELIDLLRRIGRCEGTEEELDRMMELFNANVPHPSGANLLYHPENYNARRDDLSAYDPTPEEVVERALAYRSIITPPPAPGLLEGE